MVLSSPSCARDHGKCWDLEEQYGTTTLKFTTSQLVVQVNKQSQSTGMCARSYGAQGVDPFPRRCLRELYKGV